MALAVCNRLRAIADNGTRWGRPFLAFSAGIVHHPSSMSKSVHAEDMTSPLRWAVTNCSFRASLIPSVIRVLSNPSQKALISSAVSTRFRRFSGDGACTAVHGEVDKISRLTAKLNIFRMTANVLFAMTPPRSATSSNSLITSRRVMSLAFLCPQRGSTSFSIMRLSTIHERFLGFAHFSKYSALSSATVGALRSSWRSATALAPGSIPLVTISRASA